VGSDCCRVISAEKDADGIEEVRRDTVRVILGTEEPKHDPEMAKPGARHQRLKGELQQQIAQRRSEEWSRRLQEQRLDNEEEGEQTTLCIYFLNVAYTLCRILVQYSDMLEGEL
jgi:hypothetical protein